MAEITRILAASIRRQVFFAEANSHVAVYRYEYDVQSVSYLHKNIIFFVIILILKHVRLRRIQKYLIIIPVINCPLCCMNWYSWGVIRCSHCIRTRSHRIRMVVKFYNHTSRLRNRCIMMRYYPPLVLS